MQNQTAQKVASESESPFKGFKEIFITVFVVITAACIVSGTKDKTVYHPIEETTSTTEQTSKWLNEVPSDIQKPQTVYRKSN